MSIIFHSGGNDGNAEINSNCLVTTVTGLDTHIITEPHKEDKTCIHWGRQSEYAGALTIRGHCTLLKGTLAVSLLPAPSAPPLGPIYHSISSIYDIIFQKEKTFSRFELFTVGFMLNVEIMMHILNFNQVWNGHRSVGASYLPGES